MIKFILFSQIKFLKICCLSHNSLEENLASEDSLSDLLSNLWLNSIKFTQLYYQRILIYNCLYKHIFKLFIIYLYHIPCLLTLNISLIVYLMPNLNFKLIIMENHQG